MADEQIDPIETPETCAEATEYDNHIAQDSETEPEDDELGVYLAPAYWDAIERKFARFERNYRARRIRELTRGTFVRKRSRRSRTTTEAAA